MQIIKPPDMVRSVAANAADNCYCMDLAQAAVHGAMAGLCGFLAGPINSHQAYVPLDIVFESINVVDTQNEVFEQCPRT